MHKNVGVYSSSYQWSEIMGSGYTGGSSERLWYITPSMHSHGKEFHFWVWYLHGYETMVVGDPSSPFIVLNMWVGGEVGWTLVTYANLCSFFAYVCRQDFILFTQVFLLCEKSYTIWAESLIYWCQTVWWLETSSYAAVCTKRKA